MELLPYYLFSEKVKLYIDVWNINITPSELEEVWRNRTEGVRFKTAWDKHGELVKLLRCVPAGAGVMLVFENGSVSLMNRNEGFWDSLPLVSTDRVHPCSFAEGEYIICLCPYETLYPYAKTGVFTREEAERWVTLYEEANRLIDRYSRFPEFHMMDRLKCDGSLTTAEIERHLEKLRETAKQVDEAERREEERRKAALDGVIIQGDQVSFRDTEGHTWKFTAKGRRFSREEFLRFVYRHRTDRDDSTLEDYVSSFLSRASSFTLERDGRRVTVERKPTSRGVRCMVNGQRVKTDQLVEAVVAHLRGEEQGSEHTVKVDGRVDTYVGPIRLVMNFVKEGNQWFVLCSGKRMRWRGCREDIERLQLLMDGASRMYESTLESLTKYLQLHIEHERVSEVVRDAKAVGALLSNLEGGE